MGADRFGVVVQESDDTHRNGRARKRECWYFFLLAMASLIWSAQGIAVKFLDRQMGPIAITFMPFYVTTLLFVPLLIRKRRANPDAARPTWRDWGQVHLGRRSRAGAGAVGNDLGDLASRWHRTARS